MFASAPEPRKESRKKFLLSRVFSRQESIPFRHGRARGFDEFALEAKRANPGASLYTRSDAAAIPWAQGSHSLGERSYLQALLREGPGALIDNADTEFFLIKSGKYLLPCTINDEEYDNSILCSLYNHYISSGLASFEKKDKTFKARMLCSLLKGFGSLLQSGKINKAVCVNNWLLSPNPALEIDPPALSEIRTYLTERFPDHAIVLRSISQELSPACFQALKENDFLFLPTRQVFVTDGSENQIFQTRIFKSDLRFFQASGCRVIESPDISQEEISKLYDLYCDLNIKKYSPFNPRYNIRFIDHMLRNDFFHIKALKLKDEIEGVAGYYCHHGQMSSCFFGYNPCNRGLNGIYRLLNTILLKEAEKKGMLYSQGSGGSFYKKLRRARPAMEYTAVYDRHLPPYRRLIWQILKQALDRIGIHFIENY